MLDLQRVVATLVLTLVVVASLLLFFEYTFFSRLLLLYFFTFSLLLLAAARLVLWKTWNLWRSHTRGARRVLIIGNGEYGRRLSQALKENPWDRSQTVGFLANSPFEDGLRTLDPLDAVKQVVKTY